MVEKAQNSRANKGRWYASSAILFGVGALWSGINLYSGKLIGQYSIFDRLWYSCFPGLVVLPISLGFAAIGFIRGKKEIDDGKAETLEAFIGIGSFLFSGLLWLVRMLALI